MIETLMSRCWSHLNGWGGGGGGGGGATRRLRPRTADLQSAACLAKVVVAGGGGRAAAPLVAGAPLRCQDCCCRHEVAAGLAPEEKAPAARGGCGLAAEALRSGCARNPRSPRPRGGVTVPVCRLRLLLQAKLPAGLSGENRPLSAPPPPISRRHRRRRFSGDAAHDCCRGC